MINLINPNILELTPYQPGKPEEEIKRKYNLEKVVKLASNENPLPLPQNVCDAIVREISLFNRYPDSDSYYLKEKIAAYNGIERDNVLVGAGSVEIIRMISRCFLKPGETVLSSEKSFLMYRGAAVEQGGKEAFVEAKMDEAFRFDLDNLSRLIDDKTKIIFIANPNNPTGTTLNRQPVYDFIDSVPEDKIIVLDNAYHEFVSNLDDYPDGIELAMKRKNIIVLRTFSKIYSLAALRVGYAIAHPETISYLGRVKGPFNVTRAAQAAAIASLENDDFKNKSLELNAKNREKLFTQLQNLGLKVVPSETNFLLFFPGTDPAELNEKLLQQGVIIRPMRAFGVPDGMRVSVGSEEDNDYFVSRLEKLL
ncbi:MAG: histidinol-phosphate transaminase [Candidatus Aminicenantes bacterium]|nr:histidinol-phosphate transaminase [Candidatus Aminicenantes bacterium]